MTSERTALFIAKEIADPEAINGESLKLCPVIVLFIADLVEINFGLPVTLLFIAAMTSLTLGLLMFLAEVTIATRWVRVNERFLARRREKKPPRIW